MDWQTKEYIDERFDRIEELIEQTQIIEDELEEDENIDNGTESLINPL